MKMPSRAKLILLGIAIVGGLVLCFFSFFGPVDGWRSSTLPKNMDADVQKTGESNGSVTQQTRQVIYLSSVRITLGGKCVPIPMYLETMNAAVVDEINKMRPTVIHCLEDELSRRTIEELDSPAGRTKLKREMVDAVNKLLKNGVVTKVGFGHILIQ